MNRVLLMYLIVILLLIGSNVWVVLSSKDQIYDDIDSLPHNEFGLVLGTSKFVSSGNINLYFKHRMEAAIELYKAGKIDYILVSGDNREVAYNEPKHMVEYLVDKGIPIDKIYADFAGLRTLDSVVRANTIFNQSKFTIISQKFHNKRAVFLANNHDLNTVAYNAKPVNGKQIKAKNMVREFMARVLAAQNILSKKEPKHGGEKVLQPNAFNLVE